MSAMASRWEWFDKVRAYMVVAPHLRTIYIRVPKTGTLTVFRNMIRERSGAVTYFGKEDWEFHQWAEDHALNEHELSRHKTVAMVRNPWDRAVSWWAYLHRKKAFAVGKDFKRFIIEREFEGGPYEVWNHGQPCSRWTHHNGEQMVGKILRFEDFDESAREISRMFGNEAGEIPKTNESDHLPYTEYYDDELIQAVAEMYKDDIALFGYEFGKE